MLALWSLYATASELELDGTVRWAEEVTLMFGVTTWSVDEGFVFPVRTEQGEAAGFVFVGEGQAGFRFQQPSDAYAFATTLAMAGKQAPELARQAIERQAWTEGFDLALALGPDPVLPQSIAALPVVSEAQDDVLYLSDREVIVTGWRLEEARRTAREILRERTDRLAGAGLDPRLAMDQAPWLPEQPRLLAEVRTGHSWLPFLEPVSPSLQDRWLSFAHEPTGALDDASPDTVFVHGLLDRADEDPEPRLRILTGMGALEQQGARISRAQVNVVVAAGAGLAHRVSFEAQLTLTTDVDTQLLPLAVPKSDGDEGPGVYRPYGGFHLESVASDGAELAALGPVFGPWRPEGSWQMQTWLLPEVLPAGQSTSVTLRWQDDWPASNLVDVMAQLLAILDCPSTPKLPPFGMEELGRVAGAREVLPQVIGAPRQYPAEIRVGTTLEPRWKAAVSGEVERRDDGDARWWIARTTGDARVSFGEFSEDVASAVGPFPEVRILHHTPIEASPEFVRAVLNFYGQALPPWPGSEVSVVQAPSQLVFDPNVLREICGSSMWAIDSDHRFVSGAIEDGRGLTVDAHGGQLLVSGVREAGNQVGGVESALRRLQPHAIERGVAHGLAARWWDGVGQARRDRWIAPAAAAFYRDLFLREGFPTDASLWNDLTRGEITRQVGARAFVPLVAGPQPWNGEAGGQILMALASRISERALLRGLDQFLRGPVHTTEALQQQLTQASGVELDSFFDAWIHAGLRPHVSGEWTVERGDVQVTLESDVPFGELEVPVAVVTEKGTRTSWVTLVQGRGSATLVARGKVLRVELDPEQLLPMKGELVRAGQPSAPGSGGDGPLRLVSP